MSVNEYICRHCRHDFPWFNVDGNIPRCPRCGGADLAGNPWLLLTPEAEGLTEKDHYESVLAV